jgi:transcription initiation factor TFIID subunit 1
MPFLQLQQQTREKCQEIWDRQVQSLSATDGDDNGSDTEANSDLDSFAGDLENLLDAEEFDDEDTCKGDLRSDKADGMRGLKMRRCPTHAQVNEEIEDDEAEASLAKKLLEGSYIFIFYFTLSTKITVVLMFFGVTPHISIPHD